MKLLIVLVGLAGFAGALAGTPATARMETELAEPSPLDEPRRILLALNTEQAGEVNNLLYNVVNIQKFYGMDNVEIVVVAYGAGVQALLKESSPVAARISSLQQYGIEFIACGNTLDAIKKTDMDLLDDVEVVQAGIPEIVERRLRGWVDITP